MAEQSAFLGAGVTKNVETISTTETTFRLPAIGGFNLGFPKGKCKLTGKIEGSAALLPGKGKEGILKCEEAKIEEAEAVCTVNTTGTVTTNKLKGELVWLEKTGEKAGFKFVPESGTVFMTLSITGEECPLKGTYNVEKEVIGELLPVATEVEIGEVNLPNAAAPTKTNCTTANAITKYWTNATPTRAEKTITQLGIGPNPAVICEKAEAFLVPKEKIGVFAG